MSELNQCPPVAIFGFARPESLKLVFEKVRTAKPDKLFLILDYPRSGRDDDIVGWNASKKIFEGVDWPCQVMRNYASENMGCRDRIESGITWAFEFVDRLVILEDDCVPDSTFFRFCGELLEKYKDDTRVGMIAGCDEHFHVKDIDFHGDSYYFDRYPSIWGWATWKRAWERHDPKLGYWTEFRKKFYLLGEYFQKTYALDARMIYTDQLAARTAGTWDGCWVTTMYKENWLCIHPVVNLISNYGCGCSSREENKIKAHWWNKARKSNWDRRPTAAMQFPLVHPITMLPHIESESWRFKDTQVIVPCYRLLIRKVKTLIKKTIGIR